MQILDCQRNSGLLIILKIWYNKSIFRTVSALDLRKYGTMFSVTVSL